MGTTNAKPGKCKLGPWCRGNQCRCPRTQRPYAKPGSESRPPRHSRAPNPAMPAHVLSRPSLRIEAKQRTLERAPCALRWRSHHVVESCLMKIAWGVMYRGVLSLALGTVGCHRHASVGMVRVEEAGTHLAGVRGSTSIVWPNGRVCTLSAPALDPPQRWPGDPVAPYPTAQEQQADLVDAFFFRLCEAQANGDLSPAQYQSLVDRFMALLHRRDERSTSPPPRRVQPYSRPHRDPRTWHGEDGGGLSGPIPDAETEPPAIPAETPGPSAPAPNEAPIPTRPGTAPSTGSLPTPGR